MDQSESEEVAEILNADVAVLYQVGMVWHILLIRRAKGKVFEGRLAFAGGRKEKKDKGKIRKTAKRELKEETGIRTKQKELILTEILDGPGRDPRPGERTSVLFAKKVDPRVAFEAVSPEGLELVRLPLANVTKKMMAFDHYQGILALRKTFVDHD